MFQPVPATVMIIPVIGLASLTAILAVDLAYSLKERQRKWEVALLEILTAGVLLILVLIQLARIISEVMST